MKEAFTATTHWADHAAIELIDRVKRSQYVCAAGISPSGVVHIGNFREVITVDFVVRALRDRNQSVRFIYSWDDYDALRKVPRNLPNTEMLESHLRRPLAKIPDPYGTASSYARHFEAQFEAEIRSLGISPEYIYQHEAYESGRYLSGIETAMDNEPVIRAILNRSRTEPLEQDWTCATIYCDECGRDTTRIIRMERPLHFHYHCASCKKDRQLDARKTPGLKLLWRVDWPMRWSHEQVDFEPGGKDHSSTGGSYDTGSEIARTVFHREPPVYVQYDFVLAKGLQGKLSSSSGNLITLSQALEVYEPQVVRWIFASRKPNIDFSISFDLDVMKAYDDFDRCERIHYGVEAADDKKRTYESRIYELSLIEPNTREDSCPIQFGFRHLCNVLQIYSGDLDKSAQHYALANDKNRRRFMERAQRAWRWITEYAPSEFRFFLRSESSIILTTQPGALSDLVELLQSDMMVEITEQQLHTQLFSIAAKHNLTPKTFFEAVYDALIAKKHGPRLASFLLIIGPQTAAQIIKRALA